MVRVLFTTPVLGHPPAGGPLLRIENSIKALSQISDLHIYSQVPLEVMGRGNALSFYEQYCKKFYFAPLTISNRRSISSYAKAIVNIFSQRTIKRSIMPTTQETQVFRPLLDTADDIKADVIWLGYGNISYPLLKYIKNHSSYKVVLDTDSVWSRFLLRGLPFAKNKKERQQIAKNGKSKEEEERWGTQLADVTTAVSDIDAVYYRALARHPGQVQVFSNVVDVTDYQAVPPAPDGLHKPCVYLAGSFFSPDSPMCDAARWVITEVLPLVRRQIPNIHFYIVGKGSDKTLLDIQDPDITITGELPSVLPYLCHADVALVPLRFESGTRFKILEAGACGIPVVSTTLGAEGIPVTHGKDILIADDPRSFADSIINLIKNKGFALEMSQNLEKLVCENYDVNSLVKEGRLILEYLIGTKID